MGSRLHTHQIQQWVFWLSQSSTVNLPQDHRANGLIDPVCLCRNCDRTVVLSCSYKGATAVVAVLYLPGVCAFKTGGIPKTAGGVHSTATHTHFYNKEIRTNLRP